MQVFDETCSHVLYSLLAIVPISFYSWDTEVGERESESEVEGKEVEGLSLVTLQERFCVCVCGCCV